MIILCFVLLSMNIVLSDTANIQLDGYEVKEICSSIRDSNGWIYDSVGDNCDFVGDNAYSDETKNKICFYANYSSDPIVSNKRMLSGSYEGLGPGAEDSAFFSSCGDQLMLFWDSSGWDHCVNCRCSDWLKFKPSTEYIKCDVEYTEHCVQGDCSSYILPNCGSFIDDCGTTHNCNLNKINTLCLNSSDGNCLLGESCNLSCLSGYGDCVNGLSDGCETLLNTVNNCGSCGDD